MANKNVADYTNFQDKHYQKKILQAPGGQSNFSIGWTNQKTDYGPQRNQKSIEKKKQYSVQDSNTEYPQKILTNKQQIGGQNGYGNVISKQKGQQSYNLINHEVYQEKQKKVNKVNQYETDILGNKKGTFQQNQKRKYQQLQDKRLKVEVQNYNNKPPKPPVQQDSRQQDRACIKIKGQPQSQISFGDNNYNYWKDTPNLNKQKQSNNVMNKPKSIQKIQTINSNKRIENIKGNIIIGKQQQKTSVKVKNPPGGKSNFQLG